MGEQQTCSRAWCELVAKLLELLAGELGAEIGDFAVRHIKPTHNSSDELNSGLSGEGSDQLNLDPLRELVDGDQQVLIAPH
jgi:hypothetical protein